MRPPHINNESSKTTSSFYRMDDGDVRVVVKLFT